IGGFGRWRAGGYRNSRKYGRRTHMSQMPEIVAGIDIPFNMLKDICQRYAVSELAVFGSILRRDFRDDSDVDLLVEFKPDAEIGFLTLARMQRELAAIFQRSVDLVPKAGLK